MKFTTEVIAALETLKSAAENDFERHRLAVLKKDLTYPPEVEVIDENHQKFLGVTYHKEKPGAYRQVVGIHQAVYEYYYGEVPKDCHIHHIDRNKSNNSITNLQMLTKTEHIKIHRPLALQNVVLSLWQKLREKTTARKELALYAGKNLSFRAMMILRLVRLNVVTP